MSVPEMESARAAKAAEQRAAAATAEATEPAETPGAGQPAEPAGAGEPVPTAEAGEPVPTAEAGEPVATAEGGGPAEGAAGPAEPGPRNDPGLPWHGKPRTADILCWLGIVLSGVFYWALLPLRVSLIGTHPVTAELLNGSTESIISAAAFARTGDGTLAVVLLAAIPGLMKFDILYWWAGRLWGERFIMALPLSRRSAKHMARVRRAGRKFTWPAVVVSSFLPLPRAIIFVIAGWEGMRLVTFLVLDLIGVLLWAGLLAGLGYALGHEAVVAAKTVSHYSLWFTIGLVALTVLLTVLNQRRATAG